MKRNVSLAPRTDQVESARALMANAQIQHIRLLQGSASHSPKQGSGTLRVDISASPRGSLEHATELRVLTKYSAEARRSPNSAAVIAVEATFELLYQIPAELKPTKAEIRAFAHTNAMLNSFPYWREYVQSSVARMGLPPLVLPLFRIAPPAQRRTVARRKVAK